MDDTQRLIWMRKYHGQGIYPFKGRVSFIFHISTHNGHIATNYIHLMVISIHI